MDVRTAQLTPSSRHQATGVSQLPEGLVDLLFGKGSTNINNHATIAPPCNQKRRSSRGTQSSLWELARCIVEGQQIVFITGAGMSVASGIRPFRTTNTDKSQGIGGGSGRRTTATVLPTKKKSSDSSSVSTTSSDQDKHREHHHHRHHKHQVEEQPLGIWNQVLWTQAKRETFRKDPLLWWNDFWLRYFPVEDPNKYHPNAGHWTLAALQKLFPDNIKIITQNVDGLHHKALDAVAAWSRQQRRQRPRGCKKDTSDCIRQRSRKPPKKRKIVLDSDDEEEAVTAKAYERIVEAHGKLGLYKCIPDEDSDTDSSSDEDDDRLVHLGHRRKFRAWNRKFRKQQLQKQEGQECQRQSNGESSSQSKRKQRKGGGREHLCHFQMLDSLTVDQLTPVTVQNVLRPQPEGTNSAEDDDDEEYDGDTDQDSNGSSGDDCRRRRLLKTMPRCPSCGNHVLPQALLFDEGYHSHLYYQFTNMEDWLSAAQVLVFCGTSFAVTLPLVALDHARDTNLPVYNFNVSDMLESTARLNAANIVGPSQETLPQLMQAVRYWVQRKEDLGGVLP